MSRVPRLRTARLELPPLDEADEAAVFRYASNPAVARHMTWAPHASLETTRHFLASVSTAPASQFDWGIRLDSADHIVGAVQFSFRSEAEAEIHYCLDEPYWGQGVMTEAACAVIDWGFVTHPRLERVLSSAVVENRASTRVMEKVGMSRVTSHEETWAKDGRTRHMVIYEVDRHAWRRLRDGGLDPTLR